MAINTEILAYRKVNDLCPRDGRPNYNGRKLCEYCLKKAAEKTKRYKQRKIESGLCTNCGAENPIGTSRLCCKCKDKVSVYMHNAHTKRYGSRKESGMCVDCNSTAELNKTMCVACLQKRSNNQKTKRDANISNDLCVQCGGNLGGLTGKRCKTCIDKRNDWYQGSSTQTKDKTRRDEHRITVIQHYGGRCLKCGESRPACLAIDHIEGGGNTHRKKIGKYGSGFFKWLVDNNFPEGFQILCHNCNMEKYINGDS